MVQVYLYFHASDMKVASYPRSCGPFEWVKVFRNQDLEARCAQAAVSLGDSTPHCFSQYSGRMLSSKAVVINIVNLFSFQRLRREN